jgi:signal transduction histidine kinase
MPVRTRIIGLAVWASVLAILLFAVPLGVGVLRYALQMQRNDLERTADGVALAVARDVWKHQSIQDGEDIDAIGRRDDLAVAVYDEDGDWLAGARLDDGRAELAGALDGAVSSGTDGGDLVVAVPTTHADEITGAVVATSPRSAVLPRVALVWAGMGALAALALSLVWLVGRRYARRLALPLEDLAGAARRLGDGDFSVRTHTGGVPEIDEVGLALNSTAGRLDALLARERAFSADASHQLRTPLAGLRLRLEAALERPDRDPLPAVAAGLAEAGRLEAIIEELLALSRGQRADPAGPLDVVPLLSEICSAWRERLALQGRQLDLTIDEDVSDAYAHASAAAIGQVLAVLLDNATTHGEGAVSVTVRETPGAVAIDVADEGRGVQDPASLFARRADRRDGHGMGLALARRLAEAEQGQLELTRPAPPVFTLLIPCADADLAVHSRGVLSTGAQC